MPWLLFVAACWETALCLGAPAPAWGAAHGPSVVFVLAGLLPATLAFGGHIPPHARPVLAARARPLWAAESYELRTTAPDMSGVVVPTAPPAPPPPSGGEEAPPPTPALEGANSRALQQQLSPEQELQASQLLLDVQMARDDRGVVRRVKNALIMAVVKRSNQLWQDVFTECDVDNDDTINVRLLGLEPWNH